MGEIPSKIRKLLLIDAPHHPDIEITIMKINRKSFINHLTLGSLRSSFEVENYDK